MNDARAVRTGSTWAVVVAAGDGTRMRVAGGAPQPRKPFLELGGTTILVRAVEAVARCSLIEGIVVAVACDDVARARELLEPSAARPKLRDVVAGGRRRQDTVAHALAAVPEDVEFVAIHDGARPFASVELLERAVEAAHRVGSSCVAVPCHETIKRVGADGLVRGTVDRSELWAAQTPQTFRRAELARLIDEANRDGLEVTDDTALFDRRGIPVAIVPGERTNIKITTPDDLAIAGALAARGGAAGGGGVDDSLRVGTGYDIHPLVRGRRLVVCGVELPGEFGAAGHSDADAGAHAVIDALLGAAAMGDIGRLFPDTDPAYAGADSIRLLATVRDRLAARGFGAVSVDVTVFLEKPKVGPHVERMVARLAEAAGVACDRVNVKAKTMNGMGPVGEGRAVAAQAVVLVGTVMR